MFDIGFWELCLIALVALVVIGPERLPKVAYVAGKWFGKLQRFIRNARFELERELHNYEIQQTFKEQKDELENVAETVKSAAEQIKKEFDENIPGPIEAAPKKSASKDKQNEK
ncbi:MAG: twin-arginine translocase subunit TatB [Gammaproteobacteria bacterium]|nr:twin-arginine translocase subunit TatB [Gammaproteobacteria bacterium]